MGTYILGGSNTNDDTGVLNVQGDINALSDLTVTGTATISTLTVNDSASIYNTLTVNSSNITVNGTLSTTGNSSFPSVETPIINASASPLSLQIAGSTIATLDSSGDLTTNGWVYVKGKNRAYQQNLTASTTTSTTATLLGTAISFTPAFSGYLVISATVRINNNTLGDGVNVSLLNGTTILDSETYTQEGLASNSHTLILHYELTGQTIGTALSISLNFNAVTGGTASAKIVSFTIAEI